ncbi:LysE/ArgO family amino acid transporter [Chitinimonas taiwanensis]|jgi:L-lysine exporter family protein LysE/ArgO|uniref:L-lysine exporter family protein LysE/ArgO n=1 Tax=Chitinimonas taiwanensis DSM 18899 TaxID=1121279 RepID=A0A1K2HPP1_9NEIS|nr:LysE/ArgO family amino acid transporter [Chitinimonas taiwanensis]SFZ78727.1 L-lysine exporter family protein LysE/ArgO [Chitinimonas taiwanensis DSM 18899]
MNPLYWQGLGLGSSLIVAIGAQNAHVLRMGLLRRYAWQTAAICALCDSILITIGLLGMGALLASSPALLAVARYGGAAYLAWYALRALRAATESHALDSEPNSTVSSWRSALLTALGFSLLNPHVYLDTVLLLGSIGGRNPWPERMNFGLGAITASVVWFFCLAGLASLLAPWLRRPIIWRAIDLLTAFVMGSLAISLLVFG